MNWDQFDAEAYFAKNYGSLLREDSSIIRIVADHFERYARWRPPAHAVDVGSGANLYPALTMLPFADKITLFEKAHTNREWLTSELARPAGSWWQFWLEMGGRSSYDGVTRPFQQLSRCATVEMGDVFDLPVGSYGIGTMFFVAESISPHVEDFDRALGHFVASLTPQAPFAAAFMRQSCGYPVGRRWFPACPITRSDVERGLAGIAGIDAMHEVESHLRPGYDGMIVVTGRSAPRQPDRR